MRINSTHTVLSSMFILLPFTSIAQQVPEQELLDTITVISSKIATPVREIATSVSIITSEEITARGNTNLADILRNEIGVGVSNSGGIGKNTTLRIRGEEGFRSKLYIDGVELSDPTAPQVTPIFDDILSSHVERIEILRGPQGLMYGADAGGVISITTNTGQEGLLASGKVEVGRYNSNNFAGELGFANQTGNIYIAATDFSTDGFNAQTADTSGETDGYQNTTLHVKAGLNLSANLTAQLVVRDVSSDNDYDGCFDNQTFALIFDCSTEAKNQTSRLSLDYQNSGQGHTLGLANTQVQRTFFSNNEFSFASEGEINKIDYLGHNVFGDQRLIYGFDLSREEIISSDLERKQKGVFAEYQHSFDDSLFLTAGARFDDNDQFGSHTSFRLSGAYIFPLSGKQSIKLKSTYGTGFRAPSLFEQDYNDGPFAYGDAAQLQLVEETSKGSDLGVEYSNGDKLEASVVYFEQSISDEIFFDGIAFQGYLQENGLSRSKGIELSVKQQINNILSLSGNYTYNDARTSSDEARLRRPKQQANIAVHASLLADDLSLNLGIRMVDNAVDIGQVALDNYAVVNLTTNYFISQYVQLNMRVENLFDKTYQEVAGFNNAQRSFYLGIKAQFH